MMHWLQKLFSSMVIQAQKSKTITKPVSALSKAKPNPSKAYTEGTIGFKLYALADQMSAELGFEVSIFEFRTRAVELGFKATSAKASHRHWRQFKALAA